MSKKNPMITVLITSYNHERFLPDAVDSVLKQTYDNVEISVVDDCSTDSSVEILKSYGDRINLKVREKNLGPDGYCETVNDAIRSARGEFFYRLDSDDFLDEDYFERMISCLKAEPGLDWICGGLQVVDSDKKVSDRWEYTNWPTDPDMALARGWQTCSVVVPHNGLLRTSFLRDNDLYWKNFPYGWGADVLFTLRSMQAKPNVQLIPGVGFNWRTHGANLSCDVDKRVGLILAVKEYYVQNIPTELYLNHPLLLQFEKESDEYSSARYALIANDIYSSKKNFRVPDMFRSADTKSRIDELLYQFDPVVQKYADLSLRYSSRFKPDMEKLLKMIRSDIDASEGRRSLKLGLLSRAKRKFEDSLSKNESSVEALCGLGEIASADGEIDEAMRLSARALQVDPNDSASLNNAGVLLYSRNDLQQAEQAFLKSLASDPNNVEAHHNFAELCGTVNLRVRPDKGRCELLLRSLNWISTHKPDEARADLLEENKRLRTDILKRYKGKYSDLNLRLLLHRPSNGALRYLMDSWAEVLQHMGITTGLLEWEDNTKEMLDRFQPTTLVTVADPTWHSMMDWEIIQSYRERNGLKIGQITTLDHDFVPTDFYITFHLDPSRDNRFKQLTKPLLSIPFAANPLQHYMRPGTELWDFFFVGTNSHLKISETRNYLTPILGKYRGILAGVNWETGIGQLPMTDAALLYNFAAIYPNFHMQGQLEEYNELNERTFVIAACGGFQIVDNPAAISSLFEPDEMAVAKTPTEYHEMFAYFLNRPEERTKYARKGMRRVYNEHTLFHKMDCLAEQISGSPIQNSRELQT